MAPSAGCERWGGEGQPATLCLCGELFSPTPARRPALHLLSAALCQHPEGDVTTTLTFCGKPDVTKLKPGNQAAWVKGVHLSHEATLPKAPLDRVCPLGGLSPKRSCFGRKPSPCQPRWPHRPRCRDPRGRPSSSASPGHPAWHGPPALLPALLPARWLPLLASGVRPKQEGRPRPHPPPSPCPRPSPAGPPRCSSSSCHLPFLGTRDRSKALPELSPIRGPRRCQDTPHPESHLSPAATLPPPPRKRHPCLVSSASGRQSRLGPPPRTQRRPRPTLGEAHLARLYAVRAPERHTIRFTRLSKEQPFTLVKGSHGKSPIKNPNAPKSKTTNNNTPPNAQLLSVNPGLSGPLAAHTGPCAPVVYAGLGGRPQMAARPLHLPRSAATPVQATATASLTEQEPPGQGVSGRLPQQQHLAPHAPGERPPPRRHHCRTSSRKSAAVLQLSAWVSRCRGQGRPRSPHATQERGLGSCADPDQRQGSTAET